MYAKDRGLFGQALTDAWSHKYRLERIQCNETADCSQEHIAKMCSIVQAAQRRDRKGRKAWVVALLVAAALLLTGCSVYALSEDVRNFVEELFDEYVVVFFEGEPSESVSVAIEEYYVMTMEPDGYEKVFETKNWSANITKWENAQGDFLRFAQYRAEGSMALDLEEDAVTTEIEIGGYTVHCRDGEKNHYYVWNDGRYVFLINGSQALDEQTLAGMMASIVPESALETAK